MTAEPTLLRVACARARNSATTAPNGATAPATAAQQNPLKALALLVLERNKARNNSATDGQKPAQQDLLAAPPVVARVARVARLVTCETCRHFIPDPVNPPAGAGTCRAGVGHLSIGKSLHPMAPRYCETHDEPPSGEWADLP